MNNTKIVTSEYVSYGHPDKVADQVSDALLDDYLTIDSNTRAGIETMIKDNIVIVGGEVKTEATNVNIEQTVRNVLDLVNYPDSHKLHGNDIKIINLIGEQSQEISKGVDRDDCDCIGAGDQGFVVGFASNETNEYMPLGVYIARQICKGVTLVDGLGPDVKTQVCVEYGARVPKIKSIMLSKMHIYTFDIQNVLRIIDNLIKTNRVGINNVMDDEVFFRYIKDKNIDYFINVNGKWVIGGPISDCGLTGRKIVVDQYGGYCNVGGGAFSGKDMSKVDRSGAYMCRYLAKNIVDAGLADEARVELSYVIGEPQPCAIKVELKNAHTTPIANLDKQIEMYIKEHIDLTPKGIIERFFPCGMKPIFFNTARNGHFGYNDNTTLYPWEKLDLSDKLREYIEDVEYSLLEV